MKKIISGLAAVSVAVVSAFTFGLPAQAAPADVISFTDPGFENCVGSALPGWTAGTPITQAEAATIATISCKGISSIEGAQYLTGLTDLSIQDGTLTDVSPAAGLVNTNMDFYNNQITDFSPLVNVVGYFYAGSQNFGGVPTLPTLSGGVLTQPLVLKDSKGNAAKLLGWVPARSINDVSYDGTTITYAAQNQTTDFYLHLGTSDGSISWGYNQQVVSDVPQPITYTIDLQYTFPGNGKPVPTTSGAFANSTPLDVVSTFSSPDLANINLGQATLRKNGAIRSFGTLTNPATNEYTFRSNSIRPDYPIESITGSSCPTELATTHPGDITLDQINAACAQYPGTTNWMYGAYKYTVEYQYAYNGQAYYAQQPFVYSVLLPETSDMNYFPYTTEPYCNLNSFSKTGNDITVDFTLNSVGEDFGADKVYSAGYMYGDVNITDTTTGNVLYNEQAPGFGNYLVDAFGNPVSTADFPAGLTFNGLNGTSSIDPNDSTKRIFNGNTNWKQTFADDIIGSTTDRTISIVISTNIITGWYRTVGHKVWQPEGQGITTTCTFVIPADPAPVPPTPTPTPTPVPPTPTPIPGPLPDETKNGGVDNLPYIMFGGLLFVGMAGAALTFARKRKAN